MTIYVPHETLPMLVAEEAQDDTDLWSWEVAANMSEDFTGVTMHVDRVSIMGRSCPFFDFDSEHYSSGIQYEFFTVAQITQPISVKGVKMLPDENFQKGADCSDALVEEDVELQEGDYLVCASEAKTHKPLFFAMTPEQYETHRFDPPGCGFIAA